jgi:metal-responsive CopG/Arc/MetJ family transcriptional regulator
MPTKKPVIQTVVDENIYNKFKEICNREDRSESKMAAIIIRQYIEQYEKENGRINNLGVSVTKTG